MHPSTAQEIQRILSESFSPESLEVIDDSASHKNHAHAKARPEAGHFRVIMKSALFDGLSQVQRHRLVYEKLSHLMEREIHALSLKLLAKDENNP